jgi:hypothetical protein
MTEPLAIEELLPRLRDRAADPARRTSSRPSEMMAGIRTLDLGGLLSMGRSLASQLRGVVAANQAGTVDPAGHAAAAEIERQMSAPVATVLPGTADDAAIAAAETQLGVRLPPALRRTYGEVADGGFGPGEGILPLTEVVRQYRELRSPGMMPEDRSWPDGLLPLVSMDPGWDCVEASTGRVIAWDPEELDERVTDREWARAFREIHPSVEAWLTDWVGSKTQEELHEIQMRTMRESGAYIHIRNLQGMSPDQLASVGLKPGWEAEMAANMGVPWPPPGEPGASPTDPASRPG